MRSGAMRAGVMNAAGLFEPAAERANCQAEPHMAAPTPAWNPQSFALEQIRGLVRQVFISRTGSQIRQVLFSAADAETDIKLFCRQVGEVLATEIEGNVAVVGDYPQSAEAETIRARDQKKRPVRHDGTPLRNSAFANSAIRNSAVRVQTNMPGNLWLIPPPRGAEREGSSSFLHFFLNEMRQEFEYSIVAGPPAGESNDAMAMAQVADGVILVLSAQRTRKISALKIKEMLERSQARVLGTVLSDRVFPIPAGIYRRL